MASSNIILTVYSLLQRSYSGAPQTETGFRRAASPSVIIDSFLSCCSSVAAMTMPTEGQLAVSLLCVVIFLLVVCPHSSRQTSLAHSINANAAAPLMLLRSPMLPCAVNDSTTGSAVSSCSGGIMRVEIVVQKRKIRCSDRPQSHV